MFVLTNSFDCKEIQRSSQGIEIIGAAYNDLVSEANLDIV